MEVALVEKSSSLLGYRIAENSGLRHSRYGGEREGSRIKFGMAPNYNTSVSAAFIVILVRGKIFTA